MVSIVLTLILSSIVPVRDIFPPDTIYFDADAPEKTILYPEGFVSKKGRLLTINGQRQWALEKGGTDSLTLQCNGEGDIRIPLNAVSVDKADLPADIQEYVLCIGESTTGIRSRDPYARRGKAENWVAMVAGQLPKGIRLVGDVAHGGWSTYTFLNWPCAAKLETHTPQSFFKPRTMWYALGLKSATGEDFTGSRDQLDLIVLTPFGFHPMDADKELWDLVKVLGRTDGYPGFSYDEEYNGSQRQLEMMRDWAEDLMDDPINEFYDRETAKSGHHAFNLDTYMKRCTHKSPTMAVINLGINDGDGANSHESSAECYRRLIDCFPNIPIAHFVNRWPGACYPELWEKEAITRQYDINGNTANLLRLQQLWRKEADSRPNLYELDVWHVQCGASQFEEKIAKDGRLDCSMNDVHPGYAGLKSTAHQVACWLIHVLSR